MILTLFRYLSLPVLLIGLGAASFMLIHNSQVDHSKLVQAEAKVQSAQLGIEAFAKSYEKGTVIRHEATKAKRKAATQIADKKAEADPEAWINQSVTKAQIDWLLDEENTGNK